MHIDVRGISTIRRKAGVRRGHFGLEDQRNQSVSHSLTRTHTHTFIQQTFDRDLIFVAHGGTWVN